MTRNAYCKLFASVIAIFLVATISGFAKESRTVKVIHSASVGGTVIAPGEYKLQWKSHGSDATVTLMKGKKVVTTAPAQVVDRDAEYDRSAVVYETGSDGSRSIIEMRFADSKRVLVFGGSSSAAQGSASTPAPATESTPETPAAKPGAPGDKTSEIRFLGKPFRSRRILSVPKLDQGWHVVQFKSPVLPNLGGVVQPARVPAGW